MKLILKIKPRNHSKKKRIIAWVRKTPEFNDEIIQLFEIFKDNLKISKFSKMMRYYIVSSENPAIILNLFSAIQESIPEIYFNKEDPIKIEDLFDIDS